MASESLVRTPLHDRHVAAGARLVDFAGFEMPIQYDGILKEHRRVREAAGLFDVSHMGEAEIRGTEAQSFLNSLLSNDVSVVEPLHAQYTLLLNRQGGVIDDLILYRIGAQDFLLIVNAAKIEERTVVGEVLDDTLNGHAFLQALKESFAFCAVL